MHISHSETLFNPFIDMFNETHQHAAMKSLRAKSGRNRTARDAQREATRERLLAAARKLFGQHGLEHVTVSDIGREAGVSASLINAYFDGKAGLVYAIVRENNAPQLEASKEIAARSDPPLERIFAVLRCWAELDLSDPGLLALMEAYSWTWPDETEAENRTELADFLTLLTELLRAGIVDETFRADLPVDRTAVVIFATYTWALRSAVFDQTEIDAFTEDLRSSLVPLLLNHTPPA